MAIVELVMPKMGESITEATILHWLKNPGDKIEQDESLLEVATDKVDTEVPSTHGGILKEILAREGEVVKVGKAIAIITTEGEIEVTPVVPKTEAKTPVSPGPQESPKEEVLSNGSNGSQHAENFKSPARFYSPLVKNIAKEENIDVAELEAISGTGSEGRVTKKDIIAYVQNRKLGAAVQGWGARTFSVQTPQRIPVSISGGDEIIEMDRMRKMIAERMV
ncbi:MAG: biotin/lipoyl-containing protein, partial [Cyclobacteriaceae bacterium]